MWWKKKNKRSEWMQGLLDAERLVKEEDFIPVAAYLSITECPVSLEYELGARAYHIHCEQQSSYLEEMMAPTKVPSNFNPEGRTIWGTHKD